MLELGLTAQLIYQDLVAGHGFSGSYSSVRRYVGKLKASDPQRVWRVECQPEEELQVDFGLGAPIVEAGGKTRRTWLFRAVLSYSRKGWCALNVDLLPALYAADEHQQVESLPLGFHAMLAEQLPQVG